MRIQCPVLNMMLVDHRSISTVQGSPGVDPTRVIPSQTFYEAPLGCTSHKRTTQLVVAASVDS